MDNIPGRKPRKIRYRLRKEERLRSKKLFEQLFDEGKSFLVYPLKVVWLEFNSPESARIKAAFAVSRKLYKKAVERNLIKRRMREAYRLNKHRLSCIETSAGKAVVFIYIGREIPEYQLLEKAVVRSLDNIIKAIQNP